MKLTSRRSVAMLVWCMAALLLFTAQSWAFDKKLSFSLTHYIMGMLYQQQGSVEEAIKEYKRALNVDYSNAVVHLNLALAYLKKKEIPKVIDELNLVIKLDPEAVEPHAVLALLYFSQDKSDLATVEYEQALKKASQLEPGNIEIYKSLGLIYLRQKKLDDANHIFSLATKLFPQDSEAHFYLAIILDEQKKKDEAIGELRTALQIRPDYHEALNYLGYTFVEQNANLTEAESLIKKALAIEPNNGAYIDSWGWLLYKQGKFSEAVEALKRASALIDDPVVFEHLGDAYLKIKDNENAKAAWEKSLSLNPAQQAVKDKLEKLK